MVIIAAKSFANSFWVSDYVNTLNIALFSGTNFRFREETTLAMKF
jgi:hypothetical protein